MERLECCNASPPEFVAPADEFHLVVRASSETKLIEGVQPAILLKLGISFSGRRVHFLAADIMRV
jgi:hypothetical protein